MIPKLQAAAEEKGKKEKARQAVPELRAEYSDLARKRKRKKISGEGRRRAETWPERGGRAGWCSARDARGTWARRGAIKSGLLRVLVFPNGIGPV